MIEFACTVVPNGFGDNDTARLLVEISPRCQDCGSFTAAWKKWEDYLFAARPASWKVNIDGKAVDAAVVPGHVDRNLWDVLLANAVASCTWQDLPRPKRTLVTNKLTDLTRLQQLRFAAHFDELSERLLAHAPIETHFHRPAALSRGLDLFVKPSLKGAEAPRVMSSAGKRVPVDPDVIARKIELLLRAGGGRPIEEFTHAADLAAEKLAAEELEAEKRVTSGTQGAGKRDAKAAEELDDDKAAMALLDFHGRVPDHPALRRTSGKQTVAASDQCTTYDFHEQIAILKGYPSLLRQLGLVVELEIPAASLTAIPLPVAGVASRIAIENLPAISPGICLVRAPRTPFDRTTFRLADGNGNRFSGWLALSDDSRFEFTGTDAEASTFKYLMQKRTAAGVVAGEAPPARRSTGISLLDRKRKEDLERRISLSDGGSAPRSANCPPIKSEDLAPEDLVRGWVAEVRRIDPGCETGWKSLSARNEVFQYGLKGDKTVRYPAKGYLRTDGVIRTSAARVVDRLTRAEPNKERLAVPETLFRWDGWSLALPSPFGQVFPDSAAAEGPVDEKKTPWYLNPEHTAPEGSLVPLRFGAHYLFRVRAAGPIGEALSDESASDAHMSEPVRYLRYDPIAAPQFLLVEPIDRTARPGETLHRLVLTKPTDGLATEFVERVMIPPMTTFRVAEQHGVYDRTEDPPTVVGGYRKVRLVCRPENGAWSLPSENDVPIYRAVDEGASRPFLPDPLAKYVCIRIEDKVTGDALELDPYPFYEKAWPDAKLLRFRLVVRRDGRARVSAKWDTGRGILVIALPPAWVAHVKVSSGFDHEDLPRIGALDDWERVRAHSTRAAAAGLRVADTSRNEVHHRVQCGCHEMVSPCQEIILVHPVLRPLSDPILEDIGVVRARAATDAQLATRLRFDRKSTGRISVEGTWSEWRDEPANGQPEPVQVSGRAVIPHVYLIDGKHEQSPHVTLRSPAEANDFEPRDHSTENVTLQHSFNSTRAQVVTYEATAHTRFEHEFGDKKALETRRSKKVTVAIPCSRRPLPPVVRYIVPAFSWDTQSAEVPTEPWRIHTQKRKSVLRVWLERPWRESGDDEMLAVVLWPSVTTEQASRLNKREGAAMLPPRDVPRQMEPLVTRWGMDPIWNGQPTSIAPTPNHFPDAHFVGNLLVPEPVHSPKRDDDAPIQDAEKLVAIAAYRPEFSKSRNAWFCDVKMDAVPSYWTFIRLALARYQPNSIAGMELSPVQLVDFAQIVPDRTVNVMRFPEGRDVFAVEIFGKASGPGCDIEPNRYEIAVERRCRVGNGGYVWMRDVDFLVEPRIRANDALWSATVRVGGDGARRRIVVREYEHFLADGTNWDINNPRAVSRLIYADAVEL